jgi:hypothetical protein
MDIGGLSVAALDIGLLVGRRSNDSLATTETGSFASSHGTPARSSARAISASIKN